MARMLSHLFSNMLGSVGGITYLNNPFHQIVARQRTVPVQPNTNPQVDAKVAFTDAVQAWEQTTDAKRDGWRDFAATVTFTGPLGDYHPTGRMLAIAQYQIIGYMINRGFGLFAEGLSMDPPIQPGMLVVQNPKIVAPPGGQTGFGVEATNNNGENVVLYCERSFQQSDARNFYKGPFLSPSLSADEIADAATENVPFINLNDTKVYFARGRFVSDQVPYRYSQQFILRTKAVTAV